MVKATDKPTLQGFVVEHTTPDAAVCTDEVAAYEGLPHHEAVKHSVAQYVRGQGMEGFWSMLKRAYISTLYKLSPKHLQRYAQEFAGKYHVRESDTLDQMRTVFVRLRGCARSYRRHIANDGLPPSGARG